MRADGGDIIYIMKRINLCLAFSASLLLPTVAYEVHEWGTFTTVSGSSGGYLTGLHVEEEKLPNFVYSHVGMEPGLSPLTFSMNPSFFGRSVKKADSKQIEVRYNPSDKKYYFNRVTGGLVMGSKGFPLGAEIANVSLKMETPVMYFYGGEGEKVNVKVGFNGGTISQWYPARSSGDTPNAIVLKKSQMHDSLSMMLANYKDYSLVDSKVRDFGTPYKGAIEWDVELLKKDDAYTFKHAQNPTWIYPKVADANMVKVGDEYEDYLFYRGIGNVNLPVTFSVDANEVVTVENKSAESIPFALAYEKRGDVVRYRVLDSISDTISVSEADWTVGGNNWRAEVYIEMRKGLVKQGLSKDEANGMVKTWWKSYFEHDGLRVFWVTPRSEVEKILPAKLSPSPSKFVRVIVGRADILRPSFEKDLVAKVGKKAYSQFRNDRFHAAYTNRLEQLIDGPVYQKLSEDELNGSVLYISGYKGKSTMGTGVYIHKGEEVSDQHFGQLGKWEVLNENELQIGKLHFKLDRKTGIMTAEVTDKENSKWDRYEIKLQKFIN